MILNRVFCSCFVAALVVSFRFQPVGCVLEEDSDSTEYSLSCQCQCSCSMGVSKNRGKTTKMDGL